LSRLVSSRLVSAATSPSSSSTTTTPTMLWLAEMAAVPCRVVSCRAVPCRAHLGPAGIVPRRPCPRHPGSPHARRSSMTVKTRMDLLNFMCSVYREVSGSITRSASYPHAGSYILLSISPSVLFAGLLCLLHCFASCRYLVVISEISFSVVCCESLQIHKVNYLTWCSSMFSMSANNV